MKKLLGNRKALSPVVAAIILIAVTVAVSIAVAAWMGALTFTFMKTEELKILSVSFDDPRGVTIVVQNTGTAKATIVELKMNATQKLTTDPLPLDLEAGAKATIKWETFPYVTGTTYDIEILTATGNKFISRATAPQ